MKGRIETGRISMSSGWPTDVESNEYTYEDVEYVPIMEEYDAPSVTFREEYLDYDGDVRTREWIQYERRERQIGEDAIRQQRRGRTLRFRIRFDDGERTSPFSPPRGMTSSSRCHRIVSRSLVGTERTFWMTQDGREYGRRGMWFRLMTMPAAIAAHRLVQEDARRLLEAVRTSEPFKEDTLIREGWKVCEGQWNAQTRRLDTRNGPIRLPGWTRRIKDGDLVVYAADTADGRHFVEQWTTATMRRPVRRAFGAPRRYLREWWRPIAVSIVGAGVTQYGLTSHHIVTTLIGVATVGLAVYGLGGRDRSIMTKYRSRPWILKDALSTMRSQLWVRAKWSHDRSMGWKDK